MEKLRTIWVQIKDSLWFLPGIMTVGGGALAIMLVTWNDQIAGDLERQDLWWIFGGGSDGARSVLEAISGSIITVTGVVFSVTIIALQLASSQFTPRVLRRFMADRSNQTVLGVFIGTFTYTLMVQRTIRGGEDSGFVPAVAVTGAVVLALVSIGFLIHFIDHMARSIQASVIIDSAAKNTLEVMEHVFPERLDSGAGRSGSTAAELTSDWDEDVHEVGALKAGYLQSLDRASVRKLADELDVVVRLEVEVGAFILPGQVIMSVWPGSRVSPDLDAELCDTLLLGAERTPHHDVKHGIIELMDIAVKGLSPSINDPTTAINSIQRMSQVLLDMAWREGGDRAETGEDGTVRLIVRRPRLSETVDLGLNQVRHYGCENPNIAISLITLLGELAALSPLHARQPFIDHLQAVVRSATARITDDGDLARVAAAAGEAFKRADQPPPQSRPHGRRIAPEERPPE